MVHFIFVRHSPELSELRASHKNMLVYIRVGEMLKKMGLIPNEVISSPRARCLMTGDLIMEGTGYYVADHCHEIRGKLRFKEVGYTIHAKSIFGFNGDTKRAAKFLRQKAENARDGKTFLIVGHHGTTEELLYFLGVKRAVFGREEAAIIMSSYKGGSFTLKGEI